MKKLILLAIIILISGSVFADSPFCMRLKLKLQLNDKRIVIGEFFYYGLYYPNPNPDSLTFAGILATISSTDTGSSNGEKKLILYKQVGVLENPKCYTANLFYCLQEDIIELRVSQIENCVIITKSGCHPELQSENKYMGGCPPEVITELTNDEILMLKSKPKIEFQLTQDSSKYFNSFCEPIFMSYGKLGKNEIIKILEKLLIAYNLFGKENSFLTDSQYAELKNILRKQKVVLIKTYYYN